MNTARKTLLRISFPAIFIAGATLVAGVAACGSAFWDVKPLPDSMLLRCGTQRCDPRYWQCTRTLPVVCEATGGEWPVGVARDAGSDR